MLLSIIIPCYNSEQYIERCINSLINQTFPLDNLQLIFVNDASTDHTLSILLKYEEKYPNLITVIDSPINLKQGGARNLGLQYATGDYIGFVDSDDWIEPDMYEQLYQKALSYQCDLVGCCIFRNLPDGTEISYPVDHDSYYQLTQNDIADYKLLPTIGSYNVTRIIRRSIIIDHQIQFPAHLYYEDNFFSGILQYYVKSGYYLNRCLYHYYYHPESTTSQANISSLLDRLTVELMKIEEFQKRGLFVPYYTQIEFDFFKLFYFNTMDLLFAQFDKFPSDIFPYMKETITSIFPKYINNQLLQNACSQNPYYNFFLKLLHKDFSDGELTVIGETYRKNFHISLS